MRVKRVMGWQIYGDRDGHFSGSCRSTRGVVSLVGNISVADDGEAGMESQCSPLTGQGCGQLKIETNPSSFGAMDITGMGDRRTNSWAREPTKNSIRPASCWVMIMMRSMSPCCEA